MPGQRQCMQHHAKRNDQVRGNMRLSRPSPALRTPSLAITRADRERNPRRCMDHPSGHRGHARRWWRQAAGRDETPLLRQELGAGAAGPGIGAGAPGTGVGAGAGMSRPTRFHGFLLFKHRNRTRTCARSGVFPAAPLCQLQTGNATAAGPGVGARRGRMKGSLLGDRGTEPGIQHCTPTSDTLSRTFVFLPRSSACSSASSNSVASSYLPGQDGQRKRSVIHAGGCCKTGSSTRQNTGGAGWKCRRKCHPKCHPKGRRLWISGPPTLNPPQ